MKKILPIILILVAVALLVWGVTSRNDEDVPDEGASRVDAASQETASDTTYDASATPSGSGEALDADPIAPEQARDTSTNSSADAGVRQDVGRREIVNMYDAESERQARIEMARDVFGDEGPTPCETACDCPSNSGCQQPGGICVPGLLDTPCCEWTDCPEGVSCIDADGETGVCAKR